MCQQIAKMVEEVHGDRDEAIYMNATEDCDMETLKPYTDQEVQKTAGEVLKLHQKLGHPSRQVFLKMLRDRGAGKLIRTLASIVHCPDCQEAAIPPSRRAVTLEQATELWEVIQVDNMEINIGDHSYHFQIITDEASGYGRQLTSSLSTRSPLDNLAMQPRRNVWMLFTEVGSSTLATPR